MKKSKLIVLLQTLDDREMRRFVEFVRSPYFNSNQDLIRFVSYLRDHHPGFSDKEVTRRKVYQLLFPGEPLDKKKLSYLMSDLLKLAQRFLGVQRMENQPFLFDSQVLRELTERGVEKHYNQLHRDLAGQLESQPQSSSGSYYFRYLLAGIAADHFATRKVRAFDKNLQEASDALDDYYFVQKLKFSCEMLNRQAILSDKYNLSFMEEVKNFLLSSNQLRPLVSIYLRIYFSLLKPEEEKHLEKLLSLIRAHSATIDKTELRDIFLYAINLCLRKLREGKSRYVAITLDLYEEGIRNESLFEQGHLSHWTYNNIVKLALRLERYEWIEQFIHTYNEALLPRFQEDALQYNLAELFFHRENYGQALLHLNNVRFTDINYHLGSRILLIKAFYESGALESLHSLLASFTVYLSRNKQIGGSMKKSCQNFCNLCHKVLLQNSERRKEQIYKQIRETQLLAERAWLMKVFAEQNPAFAEETSHSSSSSGG